MAVTMTVSPATRAMAGACHRAIQSASLRSRAPFAVTHGQRLAAGSRAGRRFSLRTEAAKIGVFYSTTSGKTEECAGLIKEALGDVAAAPVDIGDVKLESLKDFEGLIVGAPTWNTGADEGRSGTAWDDVLADIKGMDLSGKPVAVFGLGDQQSYGDYFVDAIEEVYSAFKAAGASMCGSWPTEGYEHSESKSELEPGMFCGLPLDEDNQDDLTQGRVDKWTQQVLAEMKISA